MLRSLLNRAAMGRSGAAFQAKSDSGDRRPCPRLLAALPDDANPPPKKKKQRQGMDELLDFMIAGPKLRKWYGERYDFRTNMVRTDGPSGSTD